MRKTDKATVVQQLTDRLSVSPNVYITDFTGIKVNRINELRRRFSQHGAHYVVVKNTLAKRALDAASITGLDDVLIGPTGFVLAGDDPVTAAKILSDFQKEEEDRPAIKAGLVDGRTVSSDEVKRLASLPTREVLMGQLAGSLQAPLAAFVGVLDGMMYQLVGVMDALRTKREGE